MTSSTERSIVAVATFILFIAFIHRLYTRGGPYFEHPATIVDHVGPGKHETRDALVLLPKVRPLLPRGAKVTCFLPHYGEPLYNVPIFFAAVGQLPDQIVLPPGSASEYVIAIKYPYIHPPYRLVAEFPEGRLYKR